MLGAYSGTGSSQAQTTQADLGDLSYWGETSNGMGKDINGKPFNYSPIINKYAKQYGIDPDFAAAVMKWESGGNAGALSNKGAIGLFQLMPGTAQQLGVNPHDVEDNIKGGIMYLRQMLDKYNGNAEMALRAYNAGPGATDAGRYPAETQKYVPGVLGIYRKFRSNRHQKQQATATQSSTPQQQPQPQTQTQPTPQGQPDREVMRDKDGTVIYQSELDEMIREGAKQGLGPLGVKNGLRQKGFEDIPEKRNVTTVAPALNWSPSYMKMPYSPIKIPKPANPLDLGWNWPSFDINKPILGGGQRQQPLPQTVPASDDSRFAPIMHSRVSALMPDLPNFSITSGDETAVIPDIFYDPTLDPAPNDPRYNATVSFPDGITAGTAYNPQPGVFPNNYNDKNRRNFIPDIPTGYYRGGVDALPWSVANWINSFKNTENPVRPPLYALGSYDEPNNKSNYSFTGNAWQGLLPVINGGASDIPRFNALTPEDLQSVISAAFYYPYDNSNIFGDDIYRYMPPMSVLNNDKSKLFMLNAARNALRRGRF